MKKKRYTRTLRDLVNDPTPPRPALISNGILPVGGSLVIFGEAGVGKSMLTHYTMHCLTMGLDWFNWRTRKAIPFMKQVELPLDEIRKRTAAFECNILIEDEYIMAYEDSHTFSDLNGKKIRLDHDIGIGHLSAQLDEIAEDWPGLPIVVIIDPVYQVTSGDLSSQYDVNKFTDNLDKVRFNRNVSFILIHHVHKAKYHEGKRINEGQDAATGSKMLTNWADSAISMFAARESDEDNWICNMKWEKHRCATRPLYNFTIKWDRGTLMPRIWKKPTTTEELTVRIGDESWNNIPFDMDSVLGCSDDTIEW